MIKSDYLKMRNENRFSSQMIYDFYAVRVDEGVNIDTFFTHLYLWFSSMEIDTNQGINHVMHIIIQHYDREFEINTLKDKLGNPIKYM